MDIATKTLTEHCRICNAKLKRRQKDICPPCAEFFVEQQKDIQKRARAALRHGGPESHDINYHGGRFGSAEW